MPWAQVVLFCLPVNPHHEIASRIAPYLAKGSLCLTIAKGLDESGRTAAQVFEHVFGGKHHYTHNAFAINGLIVFGYVNMTLKSRSC